MSAESAAKVGGAAPKDRYERELVLIRSSVRCQAKTADLLPPRTRVTGGSAGARFVLRSATTSRLRPFILARCRLPACWPRGQQARARACAAAARALAWSKKWPARGSLFADGVKIRSWVTIIQRMGCPASQPFRPDSRVLARQLVRSSFLFRLADIFISARRRGGCPGPEVPDARAEGRLSPTAVCPRDLRATTAAGSAAAVVTRRSRRWPRGRAGAVVHECAGQAGDRVRGFPAGGGDDQICCKLAAGR